MSEVTISLPTPDRKRTAIIVAGLIVSIALAVAAILYIKEHTTLAGLPRDAYAELTFPVYFPKKLPQGFTLVKDSISSKPHVLAYAYKYENGASVYMSVQPLDPKLDISSFRATREISPLIGKGYLVEYEERTTIAIVTKKAFVLMNAPEKIPGYALEQLADSLRPVK